jgi:hypothetical protein
MPWCLNQLKPLSPNVIFSVCRDKFEGGRANVLIWEAFVSGDGKGVSHSDDAAIAVNGFRDNYPSGVSAIENEDALNHAVSSALVSGLRIDVAELSLPSFVVCPLSNRAAT